MAGDPKQCREYALQCSELARKARNPAHKQMLNDLAQTWFSLAHDIEHSRAVLDSYPPQEVERKREAGNGAETGNSPRQRRA